MKIQRHWVPTAALAALGTFGLATGQENAELEAKVAELEARTQEIEGYLANQAKAAETLQKSLDASEKEGFTFGINPRSREILLQAWRARASATASNPPGSGAEEQAGVSGGGLLEK